jgi:hypothetical protein
MPRRRRFILALAAGGVRRIEVVGVIAGGAAMVPGHITEAGIADPELGLTVRSESQFKQPKLLISACFICFLEMPFIWCLGISFLAASGSLRRSNWKLYLQSRQKAKASFAERR